MFPRPDFYSGALLNFAENLLFPQGVEVADDSIAVITATEIEGHLASTSWAELREAVRKCSNALRAAGLKPKDIVAGYVSNHVQALVAMLAATSIGAIWTGISPDNGVSAVTDRLAQIGPTVLFADNGTVYNGKGWSSTEKTLQIVDALHERGLKIAIVIKNIESVELGLEDLESMGVTAVEYESFLKRYVRTGFEH